jgi:transposase-like protein
MPDFDEQRCPHCDSSDLVVINTKAITDELIECRSCMKLYRLEYDTSGASGLAAV